MYPQSSIATATPASPTTAERRACHWCKRSNVRLSYIPQMSPQTCLRHYGPAWVCSDIHSCGKQPPKHRREGGLAVPA